MAINPADFIGLGTGKALLKGLDAMGVPCKGGIEMLNEITSSPAYMKHRVDNLTDKAQDFWDDHKDDVSDFFDNVGESISDGWDSVTETISDNAEDILDGIGSFIGGLFS